MPGRVRAEDMGEMNALCAKGDGRTFPTHPYAPKGTSGTHRVSSRLVVGSVLVEREGDVDDLVVEGIGQRRLAGLEVHGVEAGGAAHVEDGVAEVVDGHAIDHDDTVSWFTNVACAVF